MCAIVEIISARFLNGVGSRIGLTGIDYPTAKWLRKYVLIRMLLECVDFLIGHN